jgi:hypothetical protein
MSAVMTALPTPVPVIEPLLSTVIIDVLFELYVTVPSPALTVTALIAVPPSSTVKFVTVNDNEELALLIANVFEQVPLYVLIVSAISALML